MLRSMYSAIGGLRGFQNKLDVIGNNIANVNTVGFKKSRVEFQDLLSQSMAGAQAPDTTAGQERGGINPKQVGLGSTISAIDVIQTQGGAMTTSVPSDLAIQGNGFFMVADKPLGGDLTSKAFYLTRAGNFTVDAAGQLVTSDGKLVLNGKGEAVNLYSITGGGTVTSSDYNIKSYSIGQDGSLTVSFEAKDPATSPASTKLTSVDATEKIALAYVQNPGGLEKLGGSLYQWTPGADMTGGVAEAGQFVHLAGESTKGGRGAIVAGQLEMSNTDLSEEFTEMIVAQRGFQANSRIITTSDSILEELVNLKR